MKILQISDTHNQHRQLTDLPAADVIVHCGDFTDNGTEEEVLNFLNWFIELPYSHKIFITGNHDLCLWEAEGIEDLPNNVYFKIVNVRLMVLSSLVWHITILRL